MEGDGAANFWLFLPGVKRSAKHLDVKMKNDGLRKKGVDVYSGRIFCVRICVRLFIKSGIKRDKSD